MARSPHPKRPSGNPKSRRDQAPAKAAPVKAKTGVGDDFPLRLNLARLFAEVEGEPETTPPPAEQVQALITGLHAELREQNRSLNEKIDRLRRDLASLSEQVVQARQPVPAPPPSSAAHVKELFLLTARRVLEGMCAELQTAGAVWPATNRALANELVARALAQPGIPAPDPLDMFSIVAQVMRDQILQRAEPSVPESASDTTTGELDETTAPEAAPAVPEAPTREWLEANLHFKTAFGSPQRLLRSLTVLQNLEVDNPNNCRYLYLKYLAGRTWEEIGLWAGRDIDTLQRRTQTLVDDMRMRVLQPTP